MLRGGEPDALAIVNEHGRWTYAQLDETSGKIARLLVDMASFPAIASCSAAPIAI